MVRLTKSIYSKLVAFTLFLNIIPLFGASMLYADKPPQFQMYASFSENRHFVAMIGDQSSTDMKVYDVKSGYVVWTSKINVNGFQDTLLANDGNILVEICRYYSESKPLIEVYFKDKPSWQIYAKDLGLNKELLKKGVSQYQWMKPIYRPNTPYYLKGKNGAEKLFVETMEGIYKIQLRKHLIQKNATTTKGSAKKD